MDTRSLLVLIVFLSVIGKMFAFVFPGQEERRCINLRVESMLKIRCYDMNLKEVPQTLKKSVEVLDLSYNRIKKLKRSSFEKYTDIKYLLLYENMIQSVEPGTFERLTSLQEVDLSNNGLITIPLELFQLPSLRNLYVDSNELINLEEDLKSLQKPIKAPLEYLNIADCGLEKLPDFGILPKLWHMNASMNPLINFSVSSFSNLCNLRSIDLTKTSMSQCTCQQVEHHLRHVNAKMQYVPICLDPLSNDVCPLPYNITVNSEAFQKCQQTVRTAEARNYWLFLGGCFGGVFIVLLIGWYCMQKAQKRRARKKKAAQSKKQLVISPKNAINNHNQEDKLINCDMV